MEISAIIETWHIGDDNCPPLDHVAADAIINRGTSPLDHYLWVEFLHCYPDPGGSCSHFSGSDLALILPGIRRLSDKMDYRGARTPTRFSDDTIRIADAVYEPW